MGTPQQDERPSSDELNVDRLRQSFYLLRERWPVVLACAIVLASTAYALSRTEVKQYMASASLLFRDPGLDRKLFGSTFVQPFTDPARQAETNATLVDLDVVAQRALRTTPLGLSAAELRRKVSVVTEGRSDVLRVQATDPSPSRAATLANAWALAYISFRRETDRATVAKAERLVQDNIDALKDVPGADARLRNLIARQQELQILASLQTGNAELVQQAEAPRSPASPHPKRNGVLGGFLGILLGIGAAFLLARLDRRMKSADEAGEAFGRPVLGAIPTSRTLGQTTELPVHEAEAFRMIRANLQYFEIDRHVSSLVVTSAVMGDGKSTVAVHLARAAASAGSSVLLVECDLRRPSLRTIFGEGGVKSGERDRGDLTSYLMGASGFDAAIDRMAIDFGQESGSLDVAFAGSMPPNPADLLASKRMQEFVTEAESRYELVIFDSPPVLVVPDAFPILKRATGAIITVRIGKTTRDEAARTHHQLTNLGVHVLGVVANDVGVDTASYGYGGYHGYTPASVA